MGASFALAGLNSCVKPPDEKILPYVKQPEFLVPGKPLKFATAFVMGGYSTGVLVTSHMGRPTRVEGNPDHPASLGSGRHFFAGIVLSLYDPDDPRQYSMMEKSAPGTSSLKSFQPSLEAQHGIGGSRTQDPHRTDHITNCPVATQGDQETLSGITMVFL